MNINFDNLNNLVFKETMQAIRESIESQMNGDSDEERRRQERQAKSINDRGLTKGKQTEVDEAEDDETGVPEDVDAEDSDTPSREDRTGGRGTKDSPKLATPNQEKLKKATIGSVVDKLNALRGGRSLKDEEVRKSFKQYFDTLTGRERQALLVFLTGIAQILAGTESGSKALDPGDVGLSVSGEVPDKSKKKSVKSQKKPDAAKPQGEATPIVVGESTNKLTEDAIKAYQRYE